MFNNKAIDVICQHTRDCKIIPIKIRLKDEDGEFQTYTIKSYKDNCSEGTYTLPNGVGVTRGIWTFDCKIAVFGQLKLIRLFYNPRDNKWTITK